MMQNCFNERFYGKKVLITGHTGFKGAWLALWLKALGADVIGYSLDAPTEPNLCDLCQIKKQIHHIGGDIRDYKKLVETLEKERVEIIFHLAAQSLVLESYNKAKETFDINAGGTVNLLEAVRHIPAVKALIMITTDKVYENREWTWGYRENDRLGGQDPYSASKSMAEIAIASYRDSFFSKSNNPVCLASVRAGNVIGGGDFANNRLVPDTLFSLMRDEAVKVRNPNSVRPWMHVLDPLSGYLCLAAALLGEKRKNYTEAWNFGPLDTRAVSCREIVEYTISTWGKGSWIDISDRTMPSEKALLRLNWEKAANRLQWQPTYSWKEAIFETVDWFKHYQNGEDMLKVTRAQIERYTAKAKEVSQSWASARESLHAV